MNSVNLIGRLTQDINLQYIGVNNKAVTRFTLAVDKNLSKNKKDECKANNVPTSDFIRIIVWGKQAENCSKYLSKGKKVAISGAIQTGSYEDKDGKTVYTTDVLANRVEFLEWGDKNKDTSSSDEFNYGVDSSELKDLDDDDIPF